MRAPPNRPVARSFAAALLAATVTSFVSSPALAQGVRTIGPGGKHCLGEPKTQRFVKQTLGVDLNPTGAEHQLTLGVCAPLVEGRGALFDYTNVQLGAVNYVSPVYAHLGGYASVAPLSLLELRAEATSLYLWPIAIDGAGYYGFRSYTDDARNAARPKENGGRAGGLELTLSATLRGAAPITKRAKVLVADTLSLDFWRVGDAPYYYNLRRDLMLARSDVLLKSSALVVAEIAVSENAALRVGPVDELSYVPGSGYVGNLVGGIATLLVRRVGPRVRSFQPFFRAGGYTHHAFRQGEYNILAGIDVFYLL